MNSVKPSRWWRRLQALAELAGDSQQRDIAETLGVSTAAVTKWKQGQQPSPEMVKAAARAYHVDALELMRIAFIDDEDDPEKATKRQSRKRQSFNISPRPDKEPL